MFELPDAKRVRREDLLSRDSSSPSASPPPESAYPDAQKRLSALLNLDSILAPPQHPAAPTTSHEANKDEEAEEQEFEFRLFRAPIARSSPADEAQSAAAAAAAGGSGTQKLRIRLRSPTPRAGVAGEGRFVNPFRGWQYYFSTPGLLSGERKESRDGGDDAASLLRRKQFDEVVVTGEELMSWSNVPWPGCRLPWRVIHLKREQTKLPRNTSPSTSTATTYLVDPPERIPKSRKKPGKKRRIQLRKRVVAEERAKETEAEKRNRKNREKKIKRRQKAREMKAAAAAGASAADQGEVVSSVETERKEEASALDHD